MAQRGKKMPRASQPDAEIESRPSLLMRLAWFIGGLGLGLLLVVVGIGLGILGFDVRSAAVNFLGEPQGLVDIAVGAVQVTFIAVGVMLAFGGLAVVSRTLGIWTLASHVAEFLWGRGSISVFMDMTRSNPIPFKIRRQIMNELTAADQKLSNRVQSRAIDEDHLSINLLEAITTEADAGVSRLAFLGAKYNQRREGEIGADLAIVLMVRTPEGMNSRWCIVQAKRFDNAKRSYLEIDRKRKKTDKQIYLMTKYHPAAHYVFYNPLNLKVERELLPFGTKFMPAGVVDYYRHLENEKLPAEIVLAHGISLAEFLVNFSSYSLAGYPPEEVKNGAADILTLTIDSSDSGGSFDVEPAFGEDHEFVLVPERNHVFVYSTFPVRVSLVPAAARREERARSAERARAGQAISRAELSYVNSHQESHEEVYDVGYADD